MQAARIVIKVIDQTDPKLWEDQAIIIDTYGNASAQHAFDLDTASTAQTGDSFARLGAPAGASIAADLVVIDNFVDGIETAVITNAAGADISADILVIDNFVDGIETAVVTNAAGADIAADIIALKSVGGVVVLAPSVPRIAVVGMAAISVGKVQRCIRWNLACLQSAE